MSTNTDANANTAQETAPNPETIPKSEHDAAPTTEPQKIKPESQSEVLTAEELADFRKYQDSKKSESEKHAAAISKAEKAKSEAEQRAADFEAKYTAMSKGVKSDSVDDVIALAKVKVSDTVTLAQAIDAVIAKYPQFSGNTNGITTGVSMQNSSGSITGVEAAFRAKNPDIKIY